MADMDSDPPDTSRGYLVVHGKRYRCAQCNALMLDFSDFEESQHDKCGGLVKMEPDVIEFRVWDELNGSEAEAKPICGVIYSRDAALVFARRDSDGIIDGVYTRNGLPMSRMKVDGHVLCVRCPDGSLKRFGVGITDHEPVFSAAELEAKT
jgi:hypothetical protein